jgi:hypothetical protein
LNIDLGSPIIDIAVALSFVFFLLSIIASALSEFWAGVFNLRAKSLRQGLEGMLGDKEAVDKLLGHELIRTELDKEVPAKCFSVGRALESIKPRERRTYERAPSYIAPAAFALAFGSIYTVLKHQTPEKYKQQEERRLLKTQVEKLPKASVTNAPTPEALEKWFDDSMARVSGWYKRKSQIVTIVFAVVVAVGLNASALRIVERLEAEPAVRAAVVAQAETAAKDEKFKPPSEAEIKAGDEPNAEEKIKAAGTESSGALDEIDALKLPLFWAGENVPQDWSQIGVAVVGWLLTAIAVSLGSPFWFDALGKLANLRMAGKRPESEPTTPPADPKAA